MRGRVGWKQSSDGSLSVVRHIDKRSPMRCCHSGISRKPPAVMCVAAYGYWVGTYIAPIICYVNSGLVREDLCIVRNKRRGAVKDDTAQLSNSAS